MRTTRPGRMPSMIRSVSKRTWMPLLAGDWRLALGCVFLSGIAFVALSLSPAREWPVAQIPQSQKRAIGAGIGFFLGLIGFEGAGFVAASKDTLLQPGNLASPQALIAAPPSIAPTFLQMHFTGNVSGGVLASVVLVFLLLDLLDTSGTLTTVGHQAGLMKDGRLPNMRRALTSDASGTMIGAVLGTSPVTAYIESAAGAGARTGLMAVTVAVLFVAALLFAPLAGAVPAYATAPALIFVAVLFARELKDVAWDDITESLPALVTALAIPLTFSIAEGIGLGFIAYTGVKLLTGRWREVGPGVAIIAVAFAAKIAFGV